MSGRSNRLYLDCSVYGGAFDPEFAARTLPLFDLIRGGMFVPVVSAVVEEEVVLAPTHVVSLYREIEKLAEPLMLLSEASALQVAYLDHRVVGPKSWRDAQHVALASVSDCLAIVSRNFRHIVQKDKIRLYNAVNQELGYNTLEILSPEELLRDGRK